MYLNLEEYVLAKEDEGIKVYHKKNPKKGYVEYKAITTLKSAEIEHFMRFFIDDTRHTQWIYKCIASEISKKENRTYLYQVLKSTWPVKNRDLSVEVITKRMGIDKITVDFISKATAATKNPKYVRLNEFSSHWEMEQINEDLFITVSASFDPRLEMGGFLLKSYTTKIPLETLKNLKKIYRLKK